MQHHGSNRQVTRSKDITDKQNKENLSETQPPSRGTVAHPFPPTPDGSNSAGAVTGTSVVGQAVTYGPAKRTDESLMNDKATLARILADTRGRTVTDPEYEILTHLVIRISFGRRLSDDEEVRNVHDAQTIVLNVLADRHRGWTAEKVEKGKFIRAAIKSYAGSSAATAAEYRAWEANMDLAKEKGLEQIATEQLELREKRLKEVKDTHNRALERGSPAHPQKRKRTFERTYDASAPNGEDME